VVAESWLVPGRTRFRRHEHDAPHLVAVVAGGFLETAGKVVRDVGAGTVRLSPPTSHHIDFAPGGARCVVVELDPGVLATPARSVFLDGDRRLAVLALAVDRATRRRDVGRRLAVEGTTAELLARVRRRLEGKWSGPVPRWLEHARQLLHDATTPPSLGPLAATVGVHRVTLARAFRDYYGTPVGAYARRLRLERARRLLAAGGLPPAAVAASTGFADQAHLTRACRAAFGVTPGGLRAAARLR